MAAIWKSPPTLEVLNSMSKNTIDANLGIEFVEIGEDYLKAKMPVDQRTKQPMGMLHGGANVVLAETLGSVASILSIDFPKKIAVGLEINANHLRSVKSGFVFGIVKPVRIGRTVHVWEINIHDDQQRHTCISRITVSIIDAR